jgi:replicative DNA helicase
VSTKNEIKANVASERAVLAALLKQGQDAFLDISYLINENTFTVDHNKLIYTCIKKCIESSTSVDLSSILSAATQLSLGEYFEKPDVLKHLRALHEFPTLPANTVDHAKRIRKLQLTREIQDKLRTIYLELNEVTGDETISEILSIPETSIHDISLSYIREESNTPKLIGDGIRDFIQNIRENPNKSPGLSTGFPQWDEAIGGGLRRKCVDLVGARSKALRYGSVVYTPSGPKKIESLEIGDVICHPYESTSIVENVFDHNTDIYRVYFRDGDFVDCCEDHLWEVYKRYPYIKFDQKKPLVKSTKELINDLVMNRNRESKEYKWDIKLTNELEFDYQEVPIDPYILGMILGDGSLFHTVKIHTGDEDRAEFHSYLLEAYGKDVKLDYIRKDAVLTTYRINGLLKHIRDLGLHKKNCHTKFIPDVYKYNSKEVRLQVLQGLMDTDGSCVQDKRSKNTRCIYSSVSIKLASDLKEIVQSLGGLCSLVKTKTYCNGKEFFTYKCEVRLPSENPFRLKRKAKLVKPRMLGFLKRTIVKIEPLEIKDNARCITVSNPDGLFLTDNYVVTHNCGKSVLADNVAIHVAGKNRIPVLMLDTEMSTDDHYARMAACLSDIMIKDVVKGTFVNNEKLETQLEKAVAYIEDMPYHYMNVSGKSFSEILNIARRWLLKEVGYDDSGNLNNCLIIYDYLKLMNAEPMSGNLSEFQVLGFMATQLHNFCVEYDCPCLSFVQLNRDGITKEGEDAVSGSDRLIWLCTSFSIFKAKTEEEVITDGPHAGNRKFIPVVARHGPGMGGDGYICVQMDKDYARIRELGTVKYVTSNEQQGFSDKEPEERDS